MYPSVKKITPSKKNGGGINGQSKIIIIITEMKPYLEESKTSP